MVTSVNEGMLSSPGWRTVCADSFSAQRTASGVSWVALIKAKIGRLLKMPTSHCVALVLFCSGLNKLNCIMLPFTNNQSTFLFDCRPDDSDDTPSRIRYQMSPSRHDCAKWPLNSRGEFLLQDHIKHADLLRGDLLDNELFLPTFGLWLDNLKGGSWVCNTEVNTVDESDKGKWKPIGMC